MNNTPIATFDALFLAWLLGEPIDGQLTSFDADTTDPAIYSRLGDPIAGLSLAPDGTWSFDPSDPAYGSLGLGESRMIVVP